MTIRLLTAACFLVCAGGMDAQSLRSGRVSSSAQASMTVRVYNYAGLSRRELTLVESVAADIFRESRIPIRWYDCGPSSRAEDDPGCGERASLATFDLRICRNCTSLATSEYGVRGYVVGSMATVSTTWSDEISRSLSVPSEYLLGRVIVHELGHLLLGPGHAPVGIMKAHWTRDDLRPNNLGMLCFTAQQATLISSKLEYWHSAKNETITLADAHLQVHSATANK